LHSEAEVHRRAQMAGHAHTASPAYLTWPLEYFTSARTKPAAIVGIDDLKNPDGVSPVPAGNVAASPTGTTPQHRRGTCVSSASYHDHVVALTDTEAAAATACLWFATTVPNSSTRTSVASGWFSAGMACADTCAYVVPLSPPLVSPRASLRAIVGW
jgi:hypothetical protein